WYAHRDALTKPNYVLVGIPNVDFSEAPRFVRRAVNHVRSELRDSFKIIIHIIHENREPCSGMALATEAKENLNLAEAHRAKARRVAPFPKPIKKQFLRVIIHRLDEISNVQDRRQTAGRN